MEMTNTDVLQPPIIKPRNGLIAFILSLLLPGLGQVYNGQPIKAAILFVLMRIIPVILGWTHAVTHFYGLITLIIFEMLLWIYIIVDAVWMAKKQINYILKPYNTWYYYLLIAVCVLALSIKYDISKITGIKSFITHSTSNNPTIQSGDWLVADMNAYRNSKPDYGDIVLYSEPNGQIYLFRIVGLPNDTVQLIDDVVSINGKLDKEIFVSEHVGGRSAISNI